MLKIFFIICLIGAGVYLYQHPDILSQAKQLPQKTGLIDDSTVVYKWQDKDGSWQITGEPPADGIPYETQKYQHDTNIIPALPEQQKK